VLNVLTFKAYVDSRLLKPRRMNCGIMCTLSILLLALCCSSSAVASIELSEKDCGRTIEASVGGVLDVVLKGNPTTGYVWSRASPDIGIIIQTSKAKFAADRMARGSSGHVYLRFKAAKAGEVLLKLIYHRPFENRPPIKTFEVKINVK
jgi:predicted secreted protein